jgi:hypothetical protein
MMSISTVVDLSYLEGFRPGFLLSGLRPIIFPLGFTTIKCPSWSIQLFRFAYDRDRG